MSKNNEVLDKVVETYLNTKASEKCKNCFCNDLCVFVLLKKGQVTTCEDWKNRVRRVVDREKESRFKMKEFIEKLIGRLEEAKDSANRHYNYGNETAYRHSIEIVNELAEEYKPIINYNTLLNDIKSQLKQFIADSNNIDYNRALVEAIEFIDKKEEEYNGGWISVSDRLPETDDDVLCWYEYYRFGEYNGMYQTYEIGHYYKSMDFWGGEVSNGHKCRVIAWQPLPEPYNPKGE